LTDLGLGRTGLQRRCWMRPQSTESPRHRLLTAVRHSANTFQSIRNTPEPHGRMNDELELRLSDWLRAVGFTEHPFLYTEAEQDLRLHEYFVEPACFDIVLGTAASPRTAVLFAPRGGGKTANRVMVDHFCKIGERTGGSVLSIAYTNFDNLIGLVSWNAQGVYWRINVHHHMVEILKRGVVETIGALGTYRLSLDGQDKDIKRSLLRILGTYGDVEWLHHARALFPRIGLDPDKDGQLLLRAHEQGQTGAVNPLRDFEVLVTTLVALGVSAVYVVVDRVDEFHPASLDPMAGALFLSPLLSHLPLLEMEQVAFKFFLPSHMKSILLNTGILRPDRLVVEEIIWSDEDLLATLHSRLNVFSEGQVPTLEPLFVSTELANEAERRLVACAEGSPRDLVLVCNRLFDTHVRHFLTDEEPRIGREALGEAIAAFTRERARWRPAPSRPLGFAPH